MKHIAIVIALLAGCSVHAQELPDKPVPHVRVNLIDESNGKKVAFTLAVPHRTADRAWWTHTIISAALTVADIENTKYLLNSNAGGHEMNPIYGRYPTRLRMYSISGAILAYSMWASYRAKREEDAAIAFGAKVRQRDLKWWLPPVANSISHAVGLALTFRNTGR